MKLFCDSEKYKIYNGSMLDMLEVIEQNSIDSIVCDPPYELGFMGKKWDSFGIAFQPKTWEKCLKVLKPGGYLLAFGGSRTFHRIAVAIEDAGFEIRDTIMWLYGSGFPKSMNIGFAVDKKNGIDNRTGIIKKDGGVGGGVRTFSDDNYEWKKEYEERMATNEWQGWGTALKPAYEPIIVARKPFKTTVVENIMKYGVGGINIDECRIPTDEFKEKKFKIKDFSNHKGSMMSFTTKKEKQNKTIEVNANNLGRFPANVIHDGSEEVISGFPDTNPTKSHDGDGLSLDTKNMGWGFKRMPSAIEDNGGSASRYFYCAKASKKDRDEGLDMFEEKMVTDSCIRSNKETAREFGANSALRKNIHPTVKPTELMQYLVRLVSPKGATILDPFMGSGSTGKAAMFENRERDANYKFIGIDLEKEYCEIAKARIDYALNKYKYDYQQELKNAEEQGQISLDLFGDVNAN